MLKHIAILFLSTSLLVSCNVSYEYDISDLSEKMYELAKYKDKGDDTISVSISEVINDEFEEYIFLPPYILYDRLGKTLGVNMETAKKAVFNENDRYYYLAVLKEKEVTKCYVLKLTETFRYNIDTLLLKNKNDSIKIVKSFEESGYTLLQ